MVLLNINMLIAAKFVTNYYYIFSFLRKQSNSFKDAFFGPIKYDYEQSSRSKRQLDHNNTNNASFDNELDSVEDEDVSSSQTEENQINIESQENSLPLESSEGGDEAINCNWNIKVINILLSF